MSVISNNILAGSSGQGGGAAGYEIERSLRFNSGDSAYLNRTPSSAGNRKTWTWAGWVKRSSLGSQQMFMDHGNASTISTDFGFNSTDSIYFTNYNGGYQSQVRTNAVLRDPSAWYHVVVAVDTTQATEANRVKIYINGTQQDLTSVNGYPAQNFDTYANVTTYGATIGARSGGSYGSNACLADIQFIDGQALTPSDFGEYDDSNVWQPKEFAGTYGTNGFHLDFSDNSSNAALGTDTSGNGNTWTVNNLSVAAGAGNDSLVDTPEQRSGQTDSGSGGEVVGNYATLNPLAITAGGAGTFTNGNLEVTTNLGGGGSCYSSIAFPSSGKWYYEITLSSGSYSLIGLSEYKASTNFNQGGSTNGLFYYSFNGNKIVNGASSAYGASYSTGTVIGVAVDIDSSSVTFYKNNASQGAVSFNAAGMFAAVADEDTGSSSAFVVNFGQRAFAYTAPSGYKALCTANLPDPTIADGSQYFDTKLWTGDNTSSRSITGLGFSPDFVWIKDRSQAFFHELQDIVRGAGKRLSSDSTSAEDSSNQTMTAFNSDGFDVNYISGYGRNTNESGDAYVGWAWDAGSSTVTNTDGSISAQVRANPSAGFSIVKWDAQSSAGTVGHGLNAAPSFIVMKTINAAGAWMVYHTNVGASVYFELNGSGTPSSNNLVYTTAPTSSVFSPGNGIVNTSIYDEMIAYCFAPVEGYSAMGSYVGNGSADGPFVFTGFRPRWILFKNSSNAAPWNIFDTARDTYNVVENGLLANSSNAEFSGTDRCDILSNGFKLKAGSGTEPNQSGHTYIYAAFAEHPQKYSRAR